MTHSLLITGGAGFIGSHLVRRMVTKYPDYQIVNLDKLTYAGNLLSLRDVEQAPNYTFVKGDIQDADLIARLFEEKQFDGVIHLAAESHVDRSILQPMAFVETNVLGTVALLNAARHFWKDKTGVRFFHVSTDEVYGSLGETGYFTEDTAYDPHSPYSASKASSDHFVRAYHDTYGLPVVITNCSNNYGPYQFPEKLIPLMIRNAAQGKDLPVYGSGENVRDWLWVEDHCAAIDLVYHEGRDGQTYNVGGQNEWTNIAVVKLICQLTDQKLGRAPGTTAEQIKFVTDRPGHDLRYAIDASKLEKELGWRPTLRFEEGLAKTVDWYHDNPEWTKQVVTGEYQKYYDENYAGRS